MLAWGAAVFIAYLRVRVAVINVLTVSSGCKPTPVSILLHWSMRSMKAREQLQTSRRDMVRPLGFALRGCTLVCESVFFCWHPRGTHQKVSILVLINSLQFIIKPQFSWTYEEEMCIFKKYISWNENPSWILQRRCSIVITYNSINIDYVPMLQCLIDFFKLKILFLLMTTISFKKVMKAYCAPFYRQVIS